MRSHIWQAWESRDSDRFLQVQSHALLRRGFGTSVPFIFLEKRAWKQHPNKQGKPDTIYSTLPTIKLISDSSKDWNGKSCKFYALPNVESHTPFQAYKTKTTSNTGTNLVHSNCTLRALSVFVAYFTCRTSFPRCQNYFRYDTPLLVVSQWGFMTTTHERQTVSVHNTIDREIFV